MLRNLKSLLAALVVLMVPAFAHAEEPTKSYPDCGREPTDAEVAAAKGAFQAGNASFNEADYARALDYWEDAYRRDCTANPLLLNLARAYELAGRKRQAVVALETFVAREPNSGEREQINRRVDVLKKKIAEEDAAAAAAPPTATGPSAPTTTAPPSPGEPIQQAKASPWPWVTMGIGVVTTTVGAAGYLGAKGKADDLAKQCKDPERRIDCPGNVKTDGDAENKKMKTFSVVSGVGVAVIVGGAIWWFLDKKAVDHANAQGTLRHPLVTPLLGPQLAGLSLSGAF